MKKTKFWIAIDAHKGRTVTLDFLEEFSEMTRNSVRWYICKQRLGKVTDGRLSVAN